MAHEMQRVYSPEEKKEFQASFHHNLVAILEGARRTGVPVIVNTMAYNYDFAPVWESQTPLTLFAAEKASLVDLRGKVDKGTADPSELYTLGRRLWHAGQPEAGRHYMDQAYAASARPFIATNAINETIREVAQAQGATLFDVKSFIDRASPTGLADHTFMADHCHINIEGNALVAAKLCEMIPSAIQLRR